MPARLARFSARAPTRRMGRSGRFCRVGRCSARRETRARRARGSSRRARSVCSWLPPIMSASVCSIVADDRTRGTYMLLENKIAVVVGGGQTPGETIGNGRATAIELAREGAKVWVADHRIESARETVAMIEAERGVARAGFVDVTDEPSIARMVADCHAAWGRIDILHNNVGVSLAGGDAPVEDITADAFDRVTSINLRGMVLACKHALPIMRAQRSGVI